MYFHRPFHVYVHIHVSQAMRNKSFYAGDAVQRRNAQDPPPPGVRAYHTLPVPERMSLVEYSRVTVKERRLVDRADDAEDAAYLRQISSRTHTCNCRYSARLIVTRHK